MEFTSSFNQTNFIGYYPPSQYDSSHYSNDGWEYHQEDTNSEHSNPWRFDSEPKMSKRIMRDNNHHHKMIHIIILMVDGSINKKGRSMNNQVK
ncbi:hypothetical protein AHAS_Ahas05G0051100 [Arachis hypogaea]